MSSFEKALEKKIEELNKQLDEEHRFRREWRDQWCKDGQEIARLRDKFRDLDVETPGVDDE